MTDQNRAVATRPAEPKAALVTGGQVAAIIPRSIEESFRLAHAIAASGMAPSSLNSPDKIMVAMMAGAELGLPPFQALQSFAVVNGRPTLWGDGLMAIARAGGAQVQEGIEGDGETAMARCTVTRPDTGETIERTFSVADAKKAGLWGKAGPWQSYPKRMLAMRARAYALRDGCADMLRGFQVREEVEDYQPIRDVTVQATGMRARLESRAAPEGGFDAEFVENELVRAVDGEPEAQTVEYVEATIDPPHDDAPADPEPVAESAPALDLADASFDALDWGASFNRGLEHLTTVDDVANAWRAAKAKGYVAKLQAKSPAMAKSLADAVNARVAEIEGGAQ